MEQPKKIFTEEEILESIKEPLTPEDEKEIHTNRRLFRWHIGQPGTKQPEPSESNYLVPKPSYTKRCKEYCSNLWKEHIKLGIISIIGGSVIFGFSYLYLIRNEPVKEKKPAGTYLRPYNNSPRDSMFVALLKDNNALKKDTAQYRQTIRISQRDSAASKQLTEKIKNLQTENTNLETSYHYMAALYHIANQKLYGARSRTHDLSDALKIYQDSIKTLNHRIDSIARRETEEIRTREERARLQQLRQPRVVAPSRRTPSRIQSPQRELTEEEALRILERIGNNK